MTTYNTYGNLNDPTRRKAIDGIGKHDTDLAKASVEALLKEITPDNLSEGFQEGRAAGQKAAEDVIRDRRERAERKASESASNTDAPGDDPGPSEPVMA